MDSCEFVSSGFEQTLEKDGAGDMVFCDPAFEPLPDKDVFVKYTKDGFNFDAQERMLGCLVSERQGAHIVLVNSGAPKLGEQYRDNGFSLTPLENMRSISCKSESREYAKDVIATH